MARSFAKQFYSGKAWQTCRNEYAARKHYLCERCMASGIYTPGEIVHHKIEIDADTVNDPGVALSFDNLELLCRKCHAAKHKAKQKGQRFTIGDDGRVIICE